MNQYGLSGRSHSIRSGGLIFGLLDRLGKVKTLEMPLGKALEIERGWNVAKDTESEVRQS